MIKNVSSSLITNTGLETTTKKEIQDIDKERRL